MLLGNTICSHLRSQSWPRRASAFHFLSMPIPIKSKRRRALEFRLSRSTPAPGATRGQRVAWRQPTASGRGLGRGRRGGRGGGGDTPGGTRVSRDGAGGPGGLEKIWSPKSVSL